MVAWIRIWKGWWQEPTIKEPFWKTIRQHSVIKMFTAHIQPYVHRVWARPHLLKIFFFETDTYSLDKWKKVFLEDIEITISSHGIVTKKLAQQYRLLTDHTMHRCNSVSITLCRCSLAHCIFCLFTWAIQANTRLLTKPYALKYCLILLRNILGKSPLMSTFLASSAWQRACCIWIWYRKCFMSSLIVLYVDDASELLRKTYHRFPGTLGQCLLNMMNVFWCCNRFFLTDNTVHTVNYMPSHLKLIN
jgi:hypothetical protein